MVAKSFQKEKLSIAVVVASPFPANHGTPAGIIEVCDEIAKLGHQNHIVTYPIGDNIPLNNAIIHRVRIPVRNRNITVGPSVQKIYWDFLLIITLCRVIFKEKIDIIHAHNYEGALVGYVAKLITGRPLIYNAVNTMIDELPTYNFIKPKFIETFIANFLDYITPRTADHIIAISLELVNFIEKKGIKKSRIDYIPLGINIEKFQGSDPVSIRKKYNIGQRPLLIYTGTLDEFQRLDYLFKAFSIVVKKHPDSLLMLISSIDNKNQKNKYLKMSRELEIEKNTIFVDSTPFNLIPSFLSAANIAVLSRPHCPGFPVKLLNYMAARKPIVTFAGSAKGLTHMKNALVFPDGDWQGMADGIINLLEDRTLAKRLAEKGFEFLKENYDLKLLTKRIDNIYNKIIT